MAPWFQINNENLEELWEDSHSAGTSNQPTVRQAETTHQAEGVVTLQTEVHNVVQHDTEVIQPDPIDDAQSQPQGDDHTASSSQSTKKPVYAWLRDPSKEAVIGSIYSNRMTRSIASREEALFCCFVSQVEPKKVEEAVEIEDWILAMQEELEQFERNRTEMISPQSVLSLYHQN